MSKEYTNKELSKPEIQAELEQTDKNKCEARTQELIGQHLTNQVVAQMRTSAAIKVSSGLRPSQLVGVLRVDRSGVAFWCVEQRFGFPYQEIRDRDMRRAIWAGLESQDEDDQLRVLIIDIQHMFAASLRIPYAPRGSA